MRYPPTLGVQTLRVLVIDADPKALETARGALGTVGCHVTYCPDSAAALEAVRHFSYDLILIDLSAAEVQGAEFAQQYGALPVRHATVIYFVSGDGDDALPPVKEKLDRDWPPLRVEGILTKPIDADALLDAVIRCANFAWLSRKGLPERERQAREDERRQREMRKLQCAVEQVHEALAKSAEESAELQRISGSRKLRKAEIERVRALERTAAQLRSQVELLRAELRRRQSEAERTNGA